MNERKHAPGWRTAWILLAALVVMLSFPGGPAFASDATEAQGIVDRAKATFNDFITDKNYSWFREHLKNAKGLIIFPQIIKGGFFIGGSGGTGVLVARNEKSGDWSQPAFYTIGSVSLGLQIGGEAAEVVVLIMNERAVASLFTSSLKLGGDVSIAVGPVGAGAKGELPATFISFAKSKGLYAGLNLDGSLIEVRDSLNNAYYGRKVSPLGIIVERSVSNPGAAELLGALNRAKR